MAGVAGGHHVLGVKHLLSQLWDCEGTVLLAAPGRQGGKAGNEEVETREGHHVDGQFAKISVQLARKSKTGGDAGHGSRDEMVEITIGGCAQLQGTEADVVEGLVVDTEALIRVLHQLMHREGGIVWFHHGV